MYEFAEASAVRRLVRLAVTSRPAAWLSVRYLHRIDAVAARLAGGRTFSAWVSGLPVVQLTTIGAKSGLPRTTPVLGVPDGSALVVIAANFGEPRHPAWYHNVRAHPDVLVTVGGRTREFRAEELTGPERDQQFDRAVRMNPGWLRFRRRAGGRQIPVLRLHPHRSL